MMKCVQTTNSGGPIISLETAAKPDTLSIVWMSISTQHNPIEGYRVYLNGQMCGNQVSLGAALCYWKSESQCITHIYLTHRDLVSRWCQIPTVTDAKLWLKAARQILSTEFVWLLFQLVRILLKSQWNLSCCLICCFESEYLISEKMNSPSYRRKLPQNVKWVGGHLAFGHWAHHPPSSGHTSRWWRYLQRVHWSPRIWRSVISSELSSTICLCGYSIDHLLMSMILGGYLSIGKHLGTILKKHGCTRHVWLFPPIFVKKMPWIKCIVIKSSVQVIISWCKIGNCWSERKYIVLNAFLFVTGFWLLPELEEISSSRLLMLVTIHSDSKVTFQIFS